MRATPDTEATVTKGLSHIKLDESTGSADCTICGTGVTAPPSFGGIPQSDMLAAFVVQHSVHTKAGVANGLTPTGRPSKAAREHFAGDAARGSDTARLAAGLAPKHGEVA